MSHVLYLSNFVQLIVFSAGRSGNKYGWAFDSRRRPDKKKYAKRAEALKAAAYALKKEYSASKVIIDEPSEEVRGLSSRTPESLAVSKRRRAKGRGYRGTNFV